MEKPKTGRFEFDRAELWADGIIHGLGVALGLAGVVILAWWLLPAARPADLVALLVYSVALLAVLVISAAYNMWPDSAFKWRLRRFDHSAIYVLIAGTYTPFLVGMSDGVVPRVLIVLVWLASLAGVAVKLAWPGRFDRLAIGLYLLIGWSGIVLWEQVLQLPATTLWLLAVGGMFYTTGVIFHVWDSLRFQNAIWHAFVLVATACHYGAVVSFVAGSPLA